MWLLNWTIELYQFNINCSQNRLNVSVQIKKETEFKLPKKVFLSTDSIVQLGAVLCLCNHSLKNSVGSKTRSGLGLLGGGRRVSLTHTTTVDSSSFLLRPFPFESLGHRGLGHLTDSGVVPPSEDWSCVMKELASGGKSSHLPQKLGLARQGDLSLCGLWFFLMEMWGVLLVVGQKPKHYSLWTILPHLFWSQLNNSHPKTRVGHMVPFLGV